MDNGKDLRPKLQSALQAALLGPAIAAVDLMMHDFHAWPPGLEILRDLAGIIGTFIIHDDRDTVSPECRRNPRQHAGEGFGGAIGGDDNGFLHQKAEMKRPGPPAVNA